MGGPKVELVTASWNYKDIRCINMTEIDMVSQTPAIEPGLLEEISVTRIQLQFTIQGM